MGLNNNASPVFRGIFALASCLALTMQVLAADSSLLARLSQDIDPDDVAVDGQRTLSNVERQLELAHNHQYKLFNKLVEDKQYRIICRKMAKTGTFLRQRQCRPRFIRRSRAASQPDANSVTFTDLRGAPSTAYRPVDLLEGMGSLAANREESKKFDRLNDLMLALGDQHPELGEAILRVHHLNRLYKALARQRYRENHP